MSSPPPPPPPQAPPFLRLLEMINGYQQTQALRVAVELGIPERLAGGPRDVAALAAETGADAGALRRFLRYLATCDVVQASPAAGTGDESYALTALGQHLRPDARPSMRAAAVYAGLPALWSGWGHLLDAVKSGTSAFETAHGAGLFDHLARHPRDAAAFNAYMASLPDMTPLQGPLADHVDLSGAASIVDVGGGKGQILFPLLERLPALRGTIHDLAAVRPDAEAAIAARGLEGRCTFDAGSFFDAVPAGADAYLLSNILHDWNDDHGLRILARCREAMTKPGAKLLVIDAFMPETHVPPIAARVDLVMLAITGGKQRTAAELRALLERAGFTVARVVPPGLLEAHVAG